MNTGKFVIEFILGHNAFTTMEFENLSLVESNTVKKLLFGFEFTKVEAFQLTCWNC